MVVRALVRTSKPEILESAKFDIWYVVLMDILLSYNVTTVNGENKAQNVVCLSQCTKFDGLGTLTMYCDDDTDQHQRVVLKLGGNSREISED